MAEIATYKCSNNLCSLTLHLSRDFPVWHPHTPRELRSPNPLPHVTPYIIRYRSESYCPQCRKVVEYENAACVVCGSEVPLEHAGRDCYQCEKGILIMPTLTVF